jgi:hypothetical protein
MNALFFSGLDMADEIEFALGYVPRILRKNPALASKCNAADFNLIRNVASCVFFLEEFDINGCKLTDLLPIVEKWVRYQEVGDTVGADAFTIAAIGRGYKLVGGAFVRPRGTLILTRGLRPFP